ncbi:MAG: DUF2652 domain-containing protein [Actinomycetota bacterium]|nr:DUF2652 domain-containing protein [Actinomycetota bacterium]
MEACYFAFQRRQRNIANLTTCACNACIRIPDLTLKFVVHHGQYISHEVAGSRELIGSEVVTAHRLLKNHVTEQTGLRGYALFTRACLEWFGVDADVVGMKSHTEMYEDVGEVDGSRRPGARSRSAPWCSWRRRTRRSRWPATSPHRRRWCGSWSRRRHGAPSGSSASSR